MIKHSVIMASNKSDDIRRPMLDEENDSFKSDASMANYDYGDEKKSCCSCLSNLCPPHIIAMGLLLVLVSILIYA